MATSITLTDSLKIIRFYMLVLGSTPVLTSVVVLLGFLTRTFSVMVFVLIVKVFITIIDSEYALRLANTLSSHVADLEIKSDELLFLLVCLLLVLVLVQFFLSKTALFVFLRHRARLSSVLLSKKLNDRNEMHLHFCLDRFPVGYEGVVRSLEILVFYVILITLIMLASPFIGLMLLVLIPLVLIAVLAKGRKEVHTLQDMNSARRTLKGLDGDIDGFVSLQSQSYELSRNGVIYSDVIGGIAIVVMMIAYIYWQELNADVGFNGISALLLAFGIRFAIVYAGELSRYLSRVLQQRVVIEHIHYP